MRPYGGEAREEMWRVVLPCAGGACNAPLRGGAREEMWRVVLPCAGGRMQCAPTGRGEGGDVAWRVAVRGGACNAPLRGGAREEMWRVVLPCAGAHAMRPYGAGRGRRCGVSCFRPRRGALHAPILGAKNSAGLETA